ncbi:tRNA (adenosine(37)-N6)-dimethylallyltransferase MiaA [Bacteroidales bacterium OttesenSCG-928-I14]|nr:tRNA (adenosine(37)-N6)-dimethylallyltransferase MiaA [Bacteroidales bacterium OttesenSCG-928-I14]
MKTLIVILGPTGVGKTDLSLKLAKKYKTPIISADSRQIYKGLTIGTAAPSIKEREKIVHHFIEELELEDYYSASQFETDTLKVLEEVFVDHDVALLCGGSMMYLDAVCKGIDEIPTIDEELRNELKTLYDNQGIEPIKEQLRVLDPVFYRQVDLDNHKRVIHALEVCLMAGKPYSELRTNTRKERPFKIIKVGLTREREELYEYINKRVDDMIERGLIEEARAVFPKRHLNSLNTVGYKELFDHFDGNSDLEFAIEKIKQNTRIYSRKQMTWFKRDHEIKWFHPDENQKVIRYINSCLNEEER